MCGNIQRGREKDKTIKANCKIQIHKYKCVAMCSAEEDMTIKANCTELLPSVTVVVATCKTQATESDNLIALFT